MEPAPCAPVCRRESPVCPAIGKSVSLQSGERLVPQGKSARPEWRHPLRGAHLDTATVRKRMGVVALAVPSQLGQRAHRLGQPTLQRWQRQDAPSTQNVNSRALYALTILCTPGGFASDQVIFKSIVL